MKWRNSKERELIAQGGSREQTLPTKSNPNPDLSDPSPLPQVHQSRAGSPKSNAHLEAMAQTRLAFNETLWTLPPPGPLGLSPRSQAEDDLDLEEGHEDDEDCEDDDEEINVT